MLATSSPRATKARGVSARRCATRSPSRARRSSVFRPFARRWGTTACCPCCWTRKYRSTPSRSNRGGRGGGRCSWASGRRYWSLGCSYYWHVGPRPAEVASADWAASAALGPGAMSTQSSARRSQTRAGRAGRLHRGAVADHPGQRAPDHAPARGARADRLSRGWARRSGDVRTGRGPGAQSVDRAPRPRARSHLPEPRHRALRLRRGLSARTHNGALGGRAAEELVYADITTGAESDLEQVTRIARQMVGRWGMSDAIGPASILPARRAAGRPARQCGRPVRDDPESRRIRDPTHRRRVLPPRAREAARESCAPGSVGRRAARARDAR